MRIELERSGGFAGVSLRASVDTENLPPEQAREWEALLDAAALPTAPTSPPSARRPDRFNYTLTIDREDGRRRLEFGESDLPETARPLVERLMERARGA